MTFIFQFGITRNGRIGEEVDGQFLFILRLKTFNNVD